MLFERGSELLTHNGYQTTISPGGFCLIQNAAPHTSVFPEPMALVTAVRVDRSALTALVRHPERAAGRPAHPDGLGASALLRGYLRAFAANRAALPSRVLQTFGLHVVDLVASIVGITRDGAAQAEIGGIKAARLREILSAIASRACDADFAVETASSQLAVTSRYVNRLLEETGHTFSEHVVEQRLRHAWRLLADPECQLKIANVAFDSGFNDLSHFNRAFRRRFGETPTSVRGTARSTVPNTVRSTSAVSDIAEQVQPFLASGALSSGGSHTSARARPK